MKKIDLHIHTIFSDGTLTPSEILSIAKNKGIAAISIVDHDEIGGAIEAISINKYEIEIIKGVEISTQKNDNSVHILGYFVDFNNKSLLNLLNFAKNAREERAKLIVDKLNKAGINISFDEIKEEAGPGVMGRLHIAEVLIKKGYAETKEDAMAKFLRKSSKFFVQRETKEPKVIIQTILEAGGIPVIAHPRILKADKFIKEFVDQGLQGIEVWYPTHSDVDIKKYLELAKKYNLIPTGGSDTHGKREGYPEFCKYTLHYEILSNLKERKFKIK